MRVSGVREAFSKFSQDFVHHPVHRRGAHAVAGAGGLLLQVFHDVVYQRELHVWRVGDDDFLPSPFGVQGNGLVGEHGEADLAFVADDFDAVHLGRFVGHEAPRARAGRAVGKLEAGAHVVFRGIEPLLVRAIAVRTDDGAEKFLEQIQLVWGEVVEIATTGNIGLYSPRQVLFVVV